MFKLEYSFFSSGKLYHVGRMVNWYGVELDKGVMKLNLIPNGEFLALNTLKIDGKVIDIYSFNQSLDLAT